MELRPIIGTILLARGSELWAILEQMDEEHRHAAARCISAAEPMPPEYEQVMAHSPVMFGTVMAGVEFEAIVKAARERINSDLFLTFLTGLALVKAAEADRTGNGDRDPYTQGLSILRDMENKMANLKENALADPFGGVAASGFTAEAKTSESPAAGHSGHAPYSGVQGNPLADQKRFERFGMQAGSGSVPVGNGRTFWQQTVDFVREKFGTPQAEGGPSDQQVSTVLEGTLKKTVADLLGVDEDQVYVVDLNSPEDSDGPDGVL